jgi:hypothetical protein
MCARRRDVPYAVGGASLFFALRFAPFQPLNCAPSDCDVVVCYGGAKPTDLYLLSTVHRMDNVLGAVRMSRRLHLEPEHFPA